MKKNIVFALALSLLVLGMSGGVAFAEYTNEVPVVTKYKDASSDKLTELKSQVEQLQAMLAKKTGVDVATVCNFDRALKTGVTGDDVKCLQDYLKANGLFMKDVSSTGYFGKMTSDAVRKWQKVMGLIESGVLDEKTLAKYKAMVGKKESHMEVAPVDATSLSPAMTAKIEITKDMMSGWNVRVMTTGIRFAPEHASQAHVLGEGHAHLYVDGKKVARVYGEWFHLDGLSSGKHEVKVSLNGNNHAPYVVNGNEVSATQIIEVVK